MNLQNNQPDASAETETVERDSQLHRYPPSRVAGLRPAWKPGQSGNPRGFPKGTPRIDHAYARLLAMSPEERAAFKPKNVAEEIALKQVNDALNLKESINIAEKITDRTDGPVVKRVEIEQQNGQADVANELLSKALNLIGRLVESRGISEAEARQLLMSRAPTLAGYLEGEIDD